jgi:pentose-5-phosphate-3-epimerase
MHVNAAMWEQVRGLAAAGADRLTLQLECVLGEFESFSRLQESSAQAQRAEGTRRVEELHALVAEIARLGVKAGLCLRPETPVSVLRPFLAGFNQAAAQGPEQLAKCAGVSLVDVLAVPPGFGGARFDAAVLAKVAALRQEFPLLDIMVDGGVGPGTARAAAEAGANLLVCGSGIFGPSEERCASDGPQGLERRARAILEEGIKGWVGSSVAGELGSLGEVFASNYGSP